MELILKITIALFGLIALYFIWQGNLDGFFVSIVLALCSSLLVARFRAKDRIAQRRAETPDN